jgi:exonuclease III
MTYTCKVATWNINGISSSTLIQMLENFLYNHMDIDLLQEVTHPKTQTTKSL